MTPEEHLKLAEPNAEFLAFVKANGAPPSPPADVEFFRRMSALRLKQIVETLGDAPPELREEEVDIPSRDGSKIKAWLVVPTSPPVSGSPVVVWFHGGGFCIGDGRDELPLARAFALQAGATTLSVSYRLAPEHRFPAAVHDAQDTLKWVTENTSKLNVNLSRGFIVGGVSAGANIATAIALSSRDENLSPPLTGQILCVPPLLPKSVYASLGEKYTSRLLSREQNGNDGFLSPAVVKMFEESYNGDDSSPLYTPFQHSSGLSNLPPTYVQACGLDPFRDEDILYEEKLRLEYGVQTRLDIYSGLPHHFWGFFPMLEVSQQHKRDIIAGLKWILDSKRAR
ncbi:hypothetical protein PVAG01_09856 [Phlyctema vagabunda]|uniref:Alpha/beta hydrolase fold-3 domain-containing protein n=1 Tax=Phlyctema vagabunda TaxID=108571 RepID=A0ABR4P495_9HELO